MPLAREIQSWTTVRKLPRQTAQVDGEEGDDPDDKEHGQTRGHDSAHQPVDDVDRHRADAEEDDDAQHT